MTQWTGLALEPFRHRIGDPAFCVAQPTTHGQFDLLEIRLEQKVFHGQVSGREMKAALNWLKQYFDFNWSPEELAAQPAQPGLALSAVVR